MEGAVIEIPEPIIPEPIIPESIIPESIIPESQPENFGSDTTPALPIVPTSPHNEAEGPVTEVTSQDHNEDEPVEDEPLDNVLTPEDRFIQESSALEEIDNFRDSCINCCEPFSATEGNPDFNECFSSVRPVFEVDQGSSLVKVSQLLSTIFKLTFLTQVEDLGEDHHYDDLPENTPLCEACASILKELGLFFQEFNRVRKVESYLSRKLEKLDDIIQHGIASINKSEDALKVRIKVEPKDVEEVVIPVDPCMSKNMYDGPWVCLTRLRSDEVPPGQSRHSSPNANGHETLGYEDLFYEENCMEAEDDGSDYAPRQTRKRKKTEDPGPKKRGKTQSIARKNKKPMTKAKNAAKRRTIAKSRKKLPRDEASDFDDPKAEADNPPPKRTKKKKNMNLLGSKKSYKDAHKRKPPARRYYEQFYRRKLKHPYPCVYCVEDFDTESDRVDHLNATHCQSKKVICPPCGKVFKNEAHMKTHIPTCGKIPPGVHLPPYICKKCNKEYATWCGLSAHDKLVHPLEKPYQCDQCSYKSSKPHFLGYHKKRAHTESASVQCYKCHKMLKSKESFLSHFERMHTEEGLKKYKEKLLQDSEQRKQKRIEVQEANDFVCKDCHVDFQSKNRLTNHRLAVHETNKRFMCDQCGKGFIESYRLRKHIQFAHTDERPYICDQCGKNYKSMDNLKTHLKTSHDVEGRQKYNEYSRLKNRQRAAVAKAQALTPPSSSSAPSGSPGPGPLLPPSLSNPAQSSMFPLEMAFNLNLQQ